MATKERYRVGGRLWRGVLLFSFSLAVDSLGTGPALAATMPSEAPSLLSAIAKVFGSLLVVVGIMLVLLYFVKRTGLGTGSARGGSTIAVLETRMVAPKKYIAIVGIADKCLALGITEHTINLLADLGPEIRSSLSTPAAVKSGSAFAGLLSKSIKSWQGSAAGQGNPTVIHDPETQEPS